MATRRTIARVEALAWVLIYGGLFAAVLGLVARDDASVLGLALIAAGAVAVAGGIALIWLRARMAEPMPAPPTAGPIDDVQQPSKGAP
ncbi:hypothetical protein WG922_08615 [Ramlibacter sp. AN1015]|uniref:hypothetical protein n=1 Tax=Ramlibacter sp. AN1015 TaxID=3133428 RepID=UPI0030C52B1A